MMKTTNKVYWSPFSGWWIAYNSEGNKEVFFNQAEAAKFAGVGDEYEVLQ